MQRFSGCLHVLSALSAKRWHKSRELLEEPSPEARYCTRGQLVCLLMLSAPYLAWLASKMRAVGGSAAVEYTRTFRLDMHAARAQLDLTGQALSERARALEWRGRWRGLRLLTDVAMHTQRASGERYIR